MLHEGAVFWRDSMMWLQGTPTRPSLAFGWLQPGSD